MTSAVVAEVDLFEGFVYDGDSYAHVMCDRYVPRGLVRRRDERFVLYVLVASEIAIANITIDQRGRSCQDEDTTEIS